MPLAYKKGQSYLPYIQNLQFSRQKTTFDWSPAQNSRLCGFLPFSTERLPTATTEEEGKEVTALL
jgi:hypothetical protein